MDARQAELLRSIDPATLGRRLRAARVAKGLTQTELAGRDVSVGYVSRIESGNRRPNGKVLAELASRLGTPVEQLLVGAAPRELDEIRLALDFAELSLESGQPIEAEVRSAEVLARVEAASLEDMVDRARLLHARALEALGRLDDSILELEALIGLTRSALVEVRAGVALSRCYRESGDLTRAIEAGERILGRLAGTPLERTDESVQLAVTVAAAYFERGDSGHAVRVCRAAMAKAEALESSTARASAYWNASMMEADRGAVGDAVALAERALALLAEGRDARNLARLRSQLGAMQLSLDPPEVTEAQRNLDRAAEDLAWSSASPVDVARNDLARARAFLISGDLAAAAELSQRVEAAMSDQAPLLRGEALSLNAQILMAQGDVTRAASCLRQAVLAMTGVGADRSAAQQWFELADLLDGVGLADASRDAYRNAAASAGVRARTGTLVDVRLNEPVRTS
ncbi:MULTISPECIES: helix-turn-helix transcriptional regulator [Nocardioides]|uniref:Helix-turn-helix domain-containing protein n=1 Tax=Nocardioides vastitatis TaxID=2568655 RepID=A0ABW0ZFC6_9ACTN|nr:helix-turn-helix transcriptional regulator [Nocardioides sp.]THJ02035.1 helix-turn-helix transcriptional regulator [Nocardioides sp.]